MSAGGSLKSDSGGFLFTLWRQAMNNNNDDRSSNSSDSREPVKVAREGAVLLINCPSSTSSGDIRVVCLPTGANELSTRSGNQF